MAKEQTLGVRLNNPGNLEWGAPWEGLVPREKSRYYKTGTGPQQRFCEFKDAASGIRAIMRTLITYADKRKAADGSAIDTVREVVSRWAPPSENNTNAYAVHVAKLMGVHPDAPINIKDYETAYGLVTGIIAHENAGYAYPAAVVEEGLRRAGVVKPITEKNNIPLTKETVAAGVAGAGSAAGIIAPILPDVAKAVTDHKADLASGDWKLLLIGLVGVGLAVWVAYAQYKRRAAGAL